MVAFIIPSKFQTFYLLHCKFLTNLMFQWRGIILQKKISQRKFQIYFDKITRAFLIIWMKNPIEHIIRGILFPCMR